MKSPLTNMSEWLQMEEDRSLSNHLLNMKPVVKTLPPVKPKLDKWKSTQEMFRTRDIRNANERLIDKMIKINIVSMPDYVVKMTETEVIDESDTELVQLKVRVAVNRSWKSVLRRSQAETSTWSYKSFQVWMKEWDVKA